MMVPAGWKRQTLEDLVTPKVGIKRGPFGGALKKEIFVSSGYCVYEQSNAIYNSFDEFRYFVTGEKFKQMEGFSVQEGDFIVSCSGTIGQIARVPSTFQEGVINQALLRIRLNGQLDPVFFLNLFRSDAFQKAISDTTQGGAMKNMVGMAEFRTTPILVPPIEEQKAIANTLSTWDRALEKTEALIKAKERRKAGLMQRLLTGKVRFGGFVKSQARRKTKSYDLPKDWGYPTIGDIAVAVSKKNGTKTSLPVLSCTKHSGLVDSLAYFGKQVFSKDLSTYKVVPRGAFAYATNHIEEGSIGYQDLHDKALISPMYTVFKTSGAVHDGFLFKLLKTEWYRHIFQTRTSASVDRRGSLRWKEFAKIHIPLPSMEEQGKIAEVLDKAEQEIEEHRNQLTALKEQKKGLMQQLLTGKVRVKVS